MLMVFLLTLACLLPSATMASAERADWVARSNENARVLLDLLARFNPEQAGQLGVDGLDAEIFQAPLDLSEQTIRAIETALDELEKRQAKETHPAVRQDLEILIDAAHQSIEGTEVNDRFLLPYLDLPNAIFQGIHSLLDERVPAERRAAAVIRLTRYAGLEEGYTPIVEQAEAAMRARFDEPGLLGPYSGQLEKDMGNAARYIEGIRALFERFDLEGWGPAYEVLRQQLAAHETFLRDELVPRTRQDFRLPEELYAFNLKGVGVDMPVTELVSRAKVAFREIQNEMQALAGLIAAQHDLPSSDYRDVLASLKKTQLVGEAILPHYQERSATIDALIAEHEVVSLPERDMVIRLASEAESAATPAPHMSPPRLIGNTGEMGEFVLPLKIPGEAGTDDVGFDDFTFDAASWTLSAHEGRPGHELQFASIIEKGVSLTRILFAFNSVNVEGWALYAEAEMKPYLPIEGQLVALQHRLLRAARAFLDPGLQLGQIERDEAFRVLEQDVVVSHAMALQEVERYTFWSPAQATAYFCGYTRLMELRAEVERRLGDRFDRQAFHDFILAQGLLPPSLLAKAVMEGFVEPQIAAATTGDKG